MSKAWGDVFPVDVRAIALEISAKQPDPIARIEGLDIGGAEGCLAKNGTSSRWGIAYSTRTRESGKVNFTIAHEFGHYLCHRQHATGTFVCTRDDITDFGLMKLADANIEQEANTFASYLLMPVKDYRQQINGANVTIDLIAGCAARYETTLAAAANKLVDFCDRPVVVMSSENQRVRWSRSSPAAFQRGLYFKKGTPVPENSATWRCAEGGVIANASGGWLAPAPIWSTRMDALESVVAQPRYGTVFTILEYKGDLSHWTAADDDDESVNQWKPMTFR